MASGPRPFDDPDCLAVLRDDGALENMQGERSLVPELFVLGVDAVAVAMSEIAVMVGSAFGPTRLFPAGNVIGLAQLPICEMGLRLVIFVVGVAL